MLYVALCIFGECLPVSVGEAGHSRSRVLFVRLDGVEVVVIDWWLTKYFLEPSAYSLEIGYVREGFPYDVGKVMRNHEVGDAGTEDVTGLGCCGPVGIINM